MQKQNQKIEKNRIGKVMICKNCIHRLIPIWKNPKIHSDSGE